MTIYVALNKFKHGIMYCIGYLPCILLCQHIEQYECRKCKIADEEGDLGILYPPALKKGAVVHFRSDSEVERSTVDCCGRLYPLLTRLKNSGLLSYQWIESTQGPPRKYYRLTEAGEAFLKELELSWQELNDTINHIRNNE